MAKATLNMELGIQEDLKVPGGFWFYFRHPGSEAWSRRIYMPPIMVRDPATGRKYPAKPITTGVI